MNRRAKFILLGLVVIAAGIAAPTVYDVATTSRFEAAYPIPSITCGCGHQEYFMLKGDRGLWWNAGHNSKEEYYYARAGQTTNDFDLYDWDKKRVGAAQFHWLWVDLQMDGYPKVRLYRQLNWMRLLIEKQQGQSQTAKYTTIEDNELKAIEYRKKKNEPNKAVEPTPVAVTVRADARPAPSTSAAHLQR